MKTSTVYRPISSRPSSTNQPPSSKVEVKPARIAILINGTNAAELRIARRLASR